MGPQPGAGDVGLAAPAVERTLVAVKPRGRKTRMLTTNSFFFAFFFTADTDCGINHSLEPSCAEPKWGLSMVALFAIGNLI